MKTINLGRALVAGWFGTLVMTIGMVLGPTMKLPRMDLAAMLGRLLAGKTPAVGSLFWIVGLVLHLIIGTVVLSTGFAAVSHYLPSSSALAKGFLYGTILWFISQTMVMPMMGAGLFSSKLPQGMMMTVSSFLGHLIYGGVLGFVYSSEQSEKRARQVLTLGL